MARATPYKIVVVLLLARGRQKIQKIKKILREFFAKKKTAPTLDRAGAGVLASSVKRPAIFSLTGRGECAPESEPHNRVHPPARCVAHPPAIQRVGGQ